MNFRFGEREEALRADIRRFLADHAPAPSLRMGGIAVAHDAEFEAAVALNRVLAGRGWIAPAWPVEYGGLGAGILEQMVFNEEFGYYGVPDTGTRGSGANIIGPTIIVHGTDEQKRRYLPRITAAEDIWCQGFSEPNAGSDLAALRTSARRDGDAYVINGQKTWTSWAHRANQMFCLVRSDPDAPKHRGITFLLIDDIQHQPGLTIRPLRDIAGEHHLSEVFFDDVRVPVVNRVGEENRGWYVAMTLLEVERSGIAVTAALSRTLDHLVRHARQEQAVWHRSRLLLADLAVANGVGRALSYRIGHLQDAGRSPTYEASAGKVFQSELGQRIYACGVNLLGLDGQLLPGERRAPLGGSLPDLLLQAVPWSIYGGSNEVQRTIIAERGLGLPRG